ncbi:MAG TPA: radical SAM protein [Cyclobacteriaceae bacterium]|nr:radical SAM protein [Cyclobacteriaceae bacterium]
MLKRLLTTFTHRVYSLPILVLMPHSRCNCRCVMCDIWKANHDKKELSVELLEKHVSDFEKLGVKEVVLSGGEALMHSNLWNFCAVLRKKKMRVVILSTGLLLERNAKEVVSNLDEVIISLDGSEAIHDRIRNVPHGYQKIANGIRELKKLNRQFRVTARSVIQRYNYFDFINTVKSAEKIGLDQISFLAADISTTAFNHVEGWTNERASEVALTLDETLELERLFLLAFDQLKEKFASGFIAERPEKLMRVVQYYKAINGHGEFPKPICNAPWVSAVIESDGNVLPCFFHKPYGNIYENSFAGIINSAKAVDFRKSLNMERDAICKKCVCSLKLGLTQMN